jgi:hypothetical protein
MTELFETVAKLEQIMVEESDPMKRYYYRQQLSQVLKQLERLER